MKTNDFIFGKNFLIDRVQKKTTVFDVDTSVFYSFNETGSTIIDLLKKNVDVETIVDRLIKKYSIKRHQAAIDVRNFIKLLLKNKIISLRKSKKNKK